MNNFILNDAIIEKMIANETVRDCRVCKRGVIQPVSHITLFIDKDGSEKIVFIPHENNLSDPANNYFSINEINLIDNEVVVTDKIIGGIIQMQKYGDLKEAILDHNRTTKIFKSYIRALIPIVKNDDILPSIPPMFFNGGV